MAGACPVLASEDPLVRGLIGVVDCNVQTLVHAGYAGLFQPGGGLANLLTSLLVIYVAVIGYRLMLGRGSLQVSEVAISAVKLGAVVALATQWDAYQALVYGFLFHAPEQLATAVLEKLQAPGSAFQGDVFDGLQRAFDDLSQAAGAFAQHTTGAGATAGQSVAQASAQTGAQLGGQLQGQAGAAQAAAGLLSGAGFGAVLLTGTAGLLLLSSLGVLLAAKLVLGLLLAIGPVFIALFLFEATRGVFEGWLRASLAFAFAPLAATLLTGLALTMLEPSLVQMEQLRTQNIYTLAPVYGVTLLVLVFTVVSAGMLVAGALVAGGLRLPPARAQGRSEGRERMALPPSTPQSLPRAARTAAAAAALERRDAQLFAGARAGAESETITAGERRTTLTVEGGRSGPAAASEVRLGQGPRRTARPRAGRAGSGRAEIGPTRSAG